MEAPKKLEEEDVKKFDFTTLRNLILLGKNLNT